MPRDLAALRSERNFARCFSIALIIAFSATPLVPASARAVPELTEPGGCQELSLSMAVAESAPADQTIAATLCTPERWAPGTPQVDVLVPGATYNRTYWDWPHRPETYSYTADTLESGRATFAFDRLGSGDSSHPTSGSVTVEAHGYILHQLVTWLRDHGFAQVNAIGHSLGTVLVANEASRWHDLDRLVLTGSLHFPAVGADSAGFALSQYPALLDPAFADRSLDPGYLTTVPGRRGPNFYDEATADPAVVSLDEELKDLSTVGETSGVVTALQTPPHLNPSRAISAAVLVVVGAKDGSFCNLLINCADSAAVAANERPYYSGAADFDAVTVPGTGHNLALHPSAPDTFRTIDRWITTGNPN
ncbi:alpha/beta hydrolase [Nocardia grenadensis]